MPNPTKPFVQFVDQRGSNIIFFVKHIATRLDPLLVSLKLEQKEGEKMDSAAAGYLSVSEL